MQYTEEHYAQMYNNLPEGLKDLVLSGRLAIMVSAIGARHALTADQIADLEPAIEDVCLGLITKEELTENIKSSINVENRVAMRISADTENDILKDYIEELKAARLFKIQLDEQIRKDNGGMPQVSGKSYTSNVPKVNTQNSDNSPRDVSEKLNSKDDDIKNFYKNTGEEKSLLSDGTTNSQTGNVQFDWESTLSKPKIHTPIAGEFKEEVKPVEAPKHTIANVEGQLATLTESINKLVNSRFGAVDSEGTAPSATLQDLIKRLEKAEKENDENRKTIKELQGIKPVQSIFGEQVKEEIKIPIDKERKVSIIKTGEELKKSIFDFSENAGDVSGNVKISSVSMAIPINTPIQNNSFSSSVSKNALDTILEMRRSTPQTNSKTESPTKQVLSMSELTGGDEKIKNAGTSISKNSTPETKIEVKSGAKSILLADIEYLYNLDQKTDISHPNIKKEIVDEALQQTANEATKETNFKSEILPATKEERMRQLQDKIKSLNKNVSSGGSTNIMNTLAGADPYRL